VISCASRYAMVSKRRIAPTTYQAGCNLTWGSSRCGVNAELYRVDSTATASDQVGRVLTVAALSGYAVGHFNGGQVVFGGTRRFVEKHAAGGALTLSYPLGGLTSAPAAVAVYPDCKKTESDCISRYNNLPNYLGWTHLPSINPYNRSAYYLEEAEVVAPPAGSTGDLPGYPGYQITLAPARVEVLSIMMCIGITRGEGATTLAFPGDGSWQTILPCLFRGCGRVPGPLPATGTLRFE